VTIARRIDLLDKPDRLLLVPSAPSSNRSCAA
jgi:hypothetical protein